MSAEPEAEWLELSTVAEPEAVESVAEAFSRWGQGVAIDQPIQSSRDGETTTVSADAPVVVRTYLPVADPSSEERRQRLDVALWALGQLRQVAPLRVRPLREADWANAWKEHFFVHRVGSRTVIVPTWRAHEYEPRPNDVVLMLDPGMAFGTGLHPTTRLCIEALERLVHPGDRVLDLGAGSGILSIAAARLGAAMVDAVEVDPVAARVCLENVRRNGVGETVRVHEGTLVELPKRGFDLVVANISFRVLSEAPTELAQRTHPGGKAVLSGVLAERADELVALFAGTGQWERVGVQQEGDWVAVELRRRGKA